MPAFITRAAMLLWATLASTPVCRAETGPAPPCVTSATPFQAAYVQQLGSGTDHETYDLDAHGYHFIPRVPMTVCSVGYTSPAMPPGRYRFQIRDINCAPGVLLSVTFDPAALAFPPLGIPHTTHQPVPPTPLVAGCTYEIRRTALDISQTYQRTGRVLTGQSPFLRGPHSIDTPLMTILSTKLVGGGGPVSNRVLPYIDFGTY